MTRTALAIATALMVGLGASAASAAESCPLCQYWPEVFGGNIKAQQAEKRRAATQQRARVRAHRNDSRDSAAAKKFDPAKTETGTIVSSDASEKAELETNSGKAAPADGSDPQLAGVGCMNFFPTVGKSLRVPCE